MRSGPLPLTPREKKWIDNQIRWETRQEAKAQEFGFSPGASNVRFYNKMTYGWMDWDRYVDVWLPYLMTGRACRKLRAAGIPHYSEAYGIDMSCNEEVFGPSPISRYAVDCPACVCLGSLRQFDIYQCYRCGSQYVTDEDENPAIVVRDSNIPGDTEVLTIASLRDWFMGSSARLNRDARMIAYWLRENKLFNFDTLSESRRQEVGRRASARRRPERKERLDRIRSITGRQARVLNVDEVAQEVVVNYALDA